MAVALETRLSRRKAPSVEAQRPDLSKKSNHELQQFSQQLDRKLYPAQNELIDKLSESVGNLRQTGQSIGQELDLHMHLLTNIEAKVETNTTKMEKLETRMHVLLENSSTSCLSFTIFMLTVVLVLLVVYL